LALWALKQSKREDGYDWRQDHNPETVVPQLQFYIILEFCIEF